MRLTTGMPTSHLAPAGAGGASSVSGMHARARPAVAPAAAPAATRRARWAGAAPALASAATAHQATATTSPLPTPPTLDALPAELHRVVVRLPDVPNPAAPGGATAAYLVGMSHVSAVSVDQVRTP